MQRSQYAAVLLQAIREASDLKQRGELMAELTTAISIMIAASCLSYRGDEGVLLDGITAACKDIRQATTDAYVAMQRWKEAARGQKT